MSGGKQPEVMVRTAVPEDAAVCGRICFEAFGAINTAHGFAQDFPGAEATTGLLSMMFSKPGWYGVVAESGGRIVGSNALDERSVICGVGPVTIDPAAQNLGVGRKLMQAVMERAKQRGAAGVRLTQAAFHNRSLALYASLGFDVREPLSCMQGRTHERSVAGCTVRPARAGDADACNALSTRVHGFDRGVELSQAIEHGTARVGRTGRSHHWVQHPPGFLWPFHSRDECGFAGPDCFGRIFRGAGPSYPFTKSCSVSLVPDERFTRGSTFDAHEHRLLQRAFRSLVAVSHFLSPDEGLSSSLLFDNRNSPGFERYA